MTVSNQSNAVAYGYDNGGRLIKVNQGTSNVSFTYDSANRRTSITLPNGIVAGYSYDTASELSGINYQLAGAMLGNLTYSYDGGGRRSQMGGTWARMSLPTPTSGAVYNAANELTQWNGVNLTYDPNGNLTSDRLNNYTWNERNQLATVKDASTGTTLASFVYDPFGRRLQNSGGDGVLYDGANEAQELSGTTPVVNRLTGGVDEFFSRTDSAGTTFPLTDALGSTIALTDSTGTVQTQYTYDPFGGSTSSGAMSTNTYQFTGRVNDGTGLYYYRARYYSPVTMRFISQDPLGLAGGVNPYIYADDNPTNLVDPLGLSSLLFCRQENKLYLLDDEYRTVGVFDAANNVQRGFHPWPSRSYEPYVYVRYHPHREAANPNSSYGSNGAFEFNVPGGRTGMEVHSGQANKGGYRHVTHGCVRTTDEATKAIKDLNETDPLNTIDVEDSCQ